MATTSLIIVRFSIRNHGWKAKNVSYHPKPDVLAPGAFIRDNTVVNTCFRLEMVFAIQPELICIACFKRGYANLKNSKDVLLSSIHFPRLTLTIQTNFRKFAYPCTTRYADFINWGVWETPSLNPALYRL